MDALETIFKPVTAMLNRQIQAKTPAREICAELDGRIFAVRVDNTALAANFVITPDQVTLTSQVDADPDVIISGSIIALLRLAAENDQKLLRDGTVTLTGNVLLAQQFAKLLQYGRPDLEEELSTVVGDSAAHAAGNAVRDISRWSRGVRDTMAQNFAEFLQEESRAVPGRHEVDEFENAVGTLRDDVARFDARLKIIESSLNETGEP